MKTVLLCLVSFLALACMPPGACATPADLYPGFGTGGKVSLPLGSTGWDVDMVVRGDGRIYVATTSEEGVPDAINVVLWCFRENGTPDTAFGAAGRVVLPGVVVEGITLQDDGKILGCGSNEDTLGNDQMVLFRLLENGMPDTTFGTNGVTVVSPGEGSSMAVLPDGKIIVCGGRGHDFLVLRCHPDGTLDTSFGTGGQVTTRFGDSRCFGSNLAVLADGKILVSGDAEGGARPAVVLARYLANGTLDATFGIGGKVVTPQVGGENGVVADMLVQPDGRIVIGGRTPDVDAFLLIRYLPNGMLDTSLGGDGIVTTSFGDETEGDGVALQSDGRLIIAGGAITSPEIKPFAVARYLPDGSLDTSFDADGRATTSMASSDAILGRVIVRPDGTILAVGSVRVAQDVYDLALVCYRGDAGPFGGADNFNDNTRDPQLWSVGDLVENNGRLVETGGHLEFRVATPTPPAVGELEGADGAFRPWFRTQASSTDSFDVFLDVHNAAQPVSTVAPPNAAASDDASIGLMVVNIQDPDDSLFLELYRDLATGAQYLGALSADGDEVGPDLLVPNSGGADATLRLSYNAAARRFDAYADPTGSANGHQWTFLGSFGVGPAGGGSIANAPWSLDLGKGFMVGIEGFSDKLAVAAGQVYADNFEAGYVNSTTGPAVALGTPSGFSTADMTLRGSVNPQGLVTNAAFHYGLTTSYGSTAPVTLAPADGIAPQQVSVALPGLQVGSIYHYRLAATNAGGTSQTVDGTFTLTQTSEVPVVGPVETEAATTSATLSGWVEGNGLHTDAEFQISPDGTTWTPVPITSTTSFLYVIVNGQPVRAVPPDGDISKHLVQVGAEVTGLQPNKEYQVRVVAVNAAGTSTGSVTSFRTQAVPPVAISSNPSSITSTSASLAGILNSWGYAVDYHFEYGTTTTYGSITAVGSLPAANGLQVVNTSLGSLAPGTLYHYRLVVTTLEGGRMVGGDVSFVTNAAGATAAPTVTMDTPLVVTSTSALLRGTVNPHGGLSTVAAVQHTGISTITLAPPSGVGNGTTPQTVVIPLNSLLPGQTYTFSFSAQNSQGPSDSNTQTFTTLPPPPEVTTGESTALTTTSVEVGGIVKAMGAATQVFVEYGTDRVTFPFSVSANPAQVTGTADTPVSAELDHLSQDTTYYYRIKAVSSGGTTYGGMVGLQMTQLSGLEQRFPAPPAESTGQLTVHIGPFVHALTAWRLAGELDWRSSSTTITGLTTSDRVVEFAPVAGLIHPPSELASITSGAAPTVLARDYYQTASTATGGLSVTLHPESITTGPGRAQWRLLGEDDSQWRDSDAPELTVAPGSYLVECKPVTGRTTPSFTQLVVSAGGLTVSHITYFLSPTSTGTTPSVLTFPQVANDPTRPYSFVGQLRSHAGTSTGFVVKQSVVATAAHVVWDDRTLSSTEGLEWIFQRHAGVHEPKPQIPRGYYLYDGYSVQREADATPGESSPEAQHLDVAALYFQEDAGRGGYGGYLASDLDDHEYLVSNASKILVGYPVDGISPPDRGRMHACTPANILFTGAFGSTYTTSAIRSSGGGSGGPLCVQHANGKYYPAAIYLGGTGQTVVRAIDSEVIALFNRAEVSSNRGGNHTGGGITHTNVATFGSASNPGGLKVIISPQGAVDAGAGWRLSPETAYRATDTQKSGLNPGAYVLQLAAVPGYAAPTAQNVTVNGGQVITVTFTYVPSLTPQESWRQTHFGSSANSGNGADNADPDHDGYTNLAEYTAGTLPLVAGDFLRSQNPSRGPGTFSLSTAGKSGRTYVLERSTTLAAGSVSWTTTATQGPLAADDTVTLTDSVSPPGRAFYRIVVTGP